MCSWAGYKWSSISNNAMAEEARTSYQLAVEVMRRTPDLPMLVRLE